MESGNAMEKGFPRAGIWVPLTPKKPGSESITRERNLKNSIHSNSMNSVDKDGGLCNGEAAFAFTDGSGIRFGVETCK